MISVAVNQLKLYGLLKYYEPNKAREILRLL